MTPTRRLPPSRWIVGGAAVGCATAWILTLTHGYTEYLLFLPLAASLVAVGSFLIVRVAGNPIGPLLLAWGVLVSYSCWIGSWTDSITTDGGTLGPGLAWAFMAVDILWHPAFALFALAVLVFPHGRLLTRRWRVAIALVVVWAVALATRSCIDPSS